MLALANQSHTFANAITHFYTLELDRYYLQGIITVSEKIKFYPLLLFTPKRNRKLHLSLNQEKYVNGRSAYPTGH